MKKIIVVIVFVACGVSLFAQTSTVGSSYVSTAVPFLTISPDSRAAGMGDVGVATSPDANSQHWNVSKYAFIDRKMGFSFAYTPWLKEVADKVSLGYVSGYYKFDKLQTVSASIRYFSLGEVKLVDINNQNAQLFTPNEFAIDFGYSRLLADELSVGVAFRYIRSNLFDGADGNSFSADISCFYTKDLERDIISFGLVVSNIGSKMRYIDGGDAYFLPANLRFGSTYTFNLNKDSKLSASLDINKLLVKGGERVDNVSNGDIVVGGVRSENSVFKSLFSSISDFANITYSFGAEYLYREQFAVRTGYFFEQEDAGNRKYFTVGVGANYHDINFDLAYLIPTTENNPLKNTMRFSVGYCF